MINVRNVYFVNDTLLKVIGKVIAQLINVQNSDMTEAQDLLRYFKLTLTANPFG